MSWDEFQNLNESQKKTFIDDQNDFIKDYKCLLIDGFKDNGNNIPMIYKEESDNLEGMIVDTEIDITTKERQVDVAGPQPL